MAHLTILKAVLKPGGSLSRTGWSKSLPNTRSAPGIVFLLIKENAMLYWSFVCVEWEK